MSQKKKRDRVPNVPKETDPAASASSTGSASASQKSSATSKPTDTKRTSQRARKRQQQRMWMMIAALGAIVVVAALIFINTQSQAAGTPPPASALAPDLINGSARGAADAPVNVTVYSDFECPACKTFAESAEKQLDEEYVATGKVLLEYKHYPLPQHEPGATWAANAAECAADQGKFWEMHDFLFQEQGKQGANTFTQGRLRSMGEALGLDTGKFNDCLSREQFRQTIRDDVNEARQLGVNATPTIYVNGQQVVFSYPEIKAAIDAALAQAGQS